MTVTDKAQRKVRKLGFVGNEENVYLAFIEPPFEKVTFCMANLKNRYYSIRYGNTA